MCNHLVWQVTSLYAYVDKGYFGFIKAYPIGLLISDQSLEVSNHKFQGHRYFFSAVQFGLQL